jgi:Tfp pilus assembly protein PilF
MNTAIAQNGKYATVNGLHMYYEEYGKVPKNEQEYGKALKNEQEYGKVPKNYEDYVGKNETKRIDKITKEAVVAAFSGIIKEHKDKILERLK